MLEASLKPPQEKGVIWSYSNSCELPQHLHIPPSREKTIFFVVTEIDLLWEKLQILNKSSSMVIYSFFISPKLSATCKKEFFEEV